MSTLSCPQRRPVARARIRARSGCVARRIASTLAALATAACSLSGLDDFDLDPCTEDRDCYVLDHVGRSTTAMCYRCDQGLCVPLDSLTERALIRDRDQGAVAIAGPTTITTSPRQQSLMVVKAAMHDREAQGWVWSSNRGLEHQGPINFERDRVSKVRDHVASYVQGDELLSVSIDHNGCADGIVRIGTARADAPFAVTSVARVAEVLPPPDQCGGVGASSAALAVARTDRRPTTALATWLLASDRFPLSRLELPDREASIMALGLSLTATSDTTDAAPSLPVVEPLGEVQVLGAGVAAVAPRLITLDDASAPVYALAYARMSELELRILEPGSDLVERDGASVDDPGVTTLALATGAPQGVPELLVAWSSSWPGETQLRAAVYRWQQSHLALWMGPVTVHTTAAQTRTLHAAYTQSGLSRTTPKGGWVLVWDESSEGRSSVLATWIVAASGRAEPARVIAHDGSYPVVFASRDAAVDFAFVATAPPDSGLSVLTCD